MAVAQEDHLTFWRVLARCTKEGVPLIRALAEAKSALTGTDLEAVLESVVDAVEGGNSLSAALGTHPAFFSRPVVALVRAGELGGVLDVLAQRIVEEIERGSIPMPGVEPDPATEMIRYWRTFATLLSSGVPILELLQFLKEGVSDDELAKATAAIHQAILKGGSIAEAMREFPDLFAEIVCAAMDDGEETGNVDVQAFRIAEALEAGDLNMLLPAGLETLSRDMAPARGFTTALLIVAIRNRASDIHMDPTEDGKGRVRLRVDGVLHDFEVPSDLDVPSEAPYAEVVHRIKIMGGMDIAQKRLPQDGRVKLNVSGKRIDLRVSTLPAMHGERVCMRILGREQVRWDIESIGLLEDDLAKVRDLCHMLHGIVLCAGPTGSGKTTLFYSMLSELDRDHRCVISVEDPIEYEIEGVAQVQVRPQIGLTFARAVRSALRQDPDVILIGEIRDTESANLAAQCALTGHLVLTSLNAATAPGGIKRLMDMGVAPFVVNASLAGVISQRLVRILCSECKQEVEAPVHSLPPEATELIGKLDSKTFYGPAGCEECKGTGYRGRTAIHEILIPDDRVKAAVAAEADLASIREAALTSGMRTLLACGIEKASRGITSIQEILRVVPHGPNE